MTIIDPATIRAAIVALEALRDDPNEDPLVKAKAKEILDELDPGVRSGTLTRALNVAVGGLVTTARLAALDVVERILLQWGGAS